LRRKFLFSEKGKTEMPGRGDSPPGAKKVHTPHPKPGGLETIEGGYRGGGGGESGIRQLNAYKNLKREIKGGESTAVTERVR